MEGYGKIAFFFWQVRICQGLQKPEGRQPTQPCGGNAPIAEKYAKICMSLKLWYTDTRTEQKQRPAFLGGRTVRSVRCGGSRCCISKVRFLAPVLASNIWRKNSAISFLYIFSYYVLARQALALRK